MTLCSCGNEEVSETSLTKAESYYQYAENAYQPYWFGDAIKKVENGYYYFNSERLYFFDTVSKQLSVTVPS